MHRYTLIISLTVIVLGADITFLRGDEKPLFAPRPRKDSKASENHAQGTGIFEMIVDKASGKVSGVYVRCSTENLFLDTDVINTFLQWRFQPNRQSAVVLVVAFTADKDDAYYPVGPRIHATNHGLPMLFKEPVKPEKLWGWFSERYGAAGHR